MKNASRLFCATAAVAVLGVVAVIATGATATAGGLHSHAPRQTLPPFVYVGYADSFRAGAPSTPTPWKGATGVTFKGCNFHHPNVCPKSKSGAVLYDSGAIRITLPAAAVGRRLGKRTVGQTYKITNVTVKVGTCTFNPWPGLNFTVSSTHPELILAQTGGKPPCDSTNKTYNFDSSDVNHTCTSNTVVPEVDVTANSTTYAFFDFSKVLTTGGHDIGAKACGHHNEVHAWVFLSQGG